MTLLDVLSTIRNGGGRLVVDGDDLRITVLPGLVTEEHKQVLAEHKPVLLRLLPDAEREAIQWAERITQAEAEVVVEQARHEWSEIVSSTHDHHHHHAEVEVVGWHEAIEPAPCGACGSIVAWWDVAGRTHCSTCTPPVRSEFLRAKAARLRTTADSKQRARQRAR